MSRTTTKALYRCIRRTTILFCAGAIIGNAQTHTNPAHHGSSSGAHVVFAHALPALSGNQLNATVVEVTYGPGGSSAPHSHPCPVIGYVIEGALRMQINHDPEVVYKAGESFYEAPNSEHIVSANASDKEPAKLLAYFICDHQAQLTVPIAGTQGTKDK